jgi:hypothetical protein
VFPSKEKHRSHGSRHCSRTCHYCPSPIHREPPPCPCHLLPTSVEPLHPPPRSRRRPHCYGAIVGGGTSQIRRCADDGWTTSTRDGGRARTAVDSGSMNAERPRPHWPSACHPHSRPLLASHTCRGPVIADPSLWGELEHGRGWMTWYSSSGRQAPRCHRWPGRARPPRATDALGALSCQTPLACQPREPRRDRTAPWAPALLPRR